MTELLKKAFDEAEKLTPAEQDALAETLLEEIASEVSWRGAFAESDREGLNRLAAEALQEHAGQRTEPLDPDSL
jgi:hypothetical protein